jgi:uncharacterized protein YkwD
MASSHDASTSNILITFNEPAMKLNFTQLNIFSLLLVSSLVSNCATSRQVPDYPYRNRPDVIIALNDYRTKNDLPPVYPNSDLALLAKKRAQHAWQYRDKNLADGHSYFNQDITEGNVRGLWFGENLYSGPPDSTNEEIINAWHNSYKHKMMMQRRTLHFCSAVETYDKSKIVVALICNDIRYKQMIQFNE